MQIIYSSWNYKCKFSTFFCFLFKYCHVEIISRDAILPTSHSNISVGAFSKPTVIKFQSTSEFSNINSCLTPYFQPLLFVIFFKWSSVYSCLSSHLWSVKANSVESHIFFCHEWKCSSNKFLNIESSTKIMMVNRNKRLHWRIYQHIPFRQCRFFEF